jgi:hypothetical protein
MVYARERGSWGDITYGDGSEFGLFVDLGRSRVRVAVVAARSGDSSFAGLDLLLHGLTRSDASLSAAHLTRSQPACGVGSTDLETSPFPPEFPF